MLPDVYRAVVHKPLLANAANALAEPELELTRLRSELAAAEFRILQLKQQLSSRKELGRFLGAIEWSRPPTAIPAWVISVEPDPYRRTFQIDRGASSGIRKRQGVVVARRCSAGSSR